MRLSRLGPALVLLGATAPALGQAHTAPPPAQEPAPPPPAPSPPAPSPPAPSPPAPPPAPSPPAPSPSPPAAPPAEAPPPAVESAPVVPAPVAPAPLTPPTVDRKPPPATPVAPPPPPAVKPALPPFERAHTALTLDARVGFGWRPQGDSGFDDESTWGSELGASLYYELKKELAAGIEIERVALGRGTAITGLDSVSVDYTAASAMLGFRAYPKRSELLDVFVGFQVGVGIQGVSASGTTNNGGVLPATVYSCGGSDVPAFQLGGGIGARLMLAPRWGITARINGTGRRLSGEIVDDCAVGIGTTTSVSGSLGLGYDFDLDR